MRILPTFEKKKRGCAYCNDMKQVHHGYQGLRNSCPYDECPYKVLDKYDTYDQFMASEDSKIPVDAFFQTMPSCYELQSNTATAKAVFRGTIARNNF
jgi:hypothetical protein